MRRLLVIGLLLLATTGCSEPPQKELAKAQTAVDFARTAGADKFAAEEYTAATTGLQKARDAVAQRNYRQALSYAIDARQRAQNAIRQAGEGKARAQRATDTLITAVNARVTELQTRLTAAEAARVPAKELRASRAVVADVQKDLQEARTQVGEGNYEEADEILRTVRKKLDEAIQNVERIPPRPPRAAKRRRG